MKSHVGLFAGEPITPEEERTAQVVDEYLRVHEAAGLLHVHPSTVRGWCHRGLLRRYGGPRTWRVRRVELLLLFASLTGTPNPIRRMAIEILRKAGE